jgi:hypothetical protein
VHSITAQPLLCIAWLQPGVVLTQALPLCGTLLVQATTPLDPRVVDKMLPFMTEQYGNPHSRTHLYGWEAEDAVEVARAQVCAGKANLTLPATLPRHQLPACVALQCLC